MYPWGDHLDTVNQALVALFVVLLLTLVLMGRTTGPQLAAIYILLGAWWVIYAKRGSEIRSKLGRN